MHKPVVRPAPLSADVLIEHALLAAAMLGLVAMLSFPAARGVDATFGWLPFWLTALPLSAWAMARTLRSRRSRRHAARPMARVHRLRTARPTTEAGGRSDRALRRAA